MRFLIVLALFAQAPATPDHPFPNHEMPPNGWYCSPAGSAEDVATDPHACSCMGMVKDPVCETTVLDPDTGDTSQVPATNDNGGCKVFCHKDNCTCMVICSDSIHARR